MFQFNNLTTHHFRNKDKGFTLVELILAIFVITVGLIGVYGVYSRIIFYTAVSISRLTASYLAQEGIEIVRNIRDTNWLEETSWNEELDAGNWEADYEDDSLRHCSSPCDYNNLRFLYIDGNFYKYSSSGTQTKFKRKITIEPGTDSAGKEILEVKVDVLWDEKGKSYEVAVQENLYDWFR